MDVDNEVCFHRLVVGNQRYLKLADEFYVCCVLRHISAYHLNVSVTEENSDIMRRSSPTRKEIS